MTVPAHSRHPGRRGRYRTVRLGSIGPAPGPAARLVSADLLSEDATSRHGGTEPDLVLVAGASAGGPERLSAAVIDAFIRCEQQAVPTVLLAAHPDDLETPVAAVCRDVASEDHGTILHARQVFGADRAHHLPTPAGWGARRDRRWLKAMVTGVEATQTQAPAARARSLRNLSGRIRSRLPIPRRP